MALSSDLISQLVKATKPVETKPTEATVYGTTVEQNGELFVQIDGSDVITPVASTVKMKSGERVMVTIKDHAAVVTGNLTIQAARVDDVEDIADEISVFEIVVADKVTTEELEAERGRINELISDHVTVNRIEAVEGVIDKLDSTYATIDNLEVEKGRINDLDVTKLNAEVATLTYATIGSMEATEAVIYSLTSTYATISDLEVETARINDLETKKLSADDASIKYANIDFANIGEAAIEKMFSDSGIIKDLVMSGGAVTGELVGVTIKGDLIEGNTIKADKLVVRGKDGIYYKLNVDSGGVESTEIAEEELQKGLLGTVIIAKSITANQIAVDDLVAFDATIGGFNITNESLYSGVKASADNTTRGVYLDRDGQFSVGDSNNFMRYNKTDDGSYKLEISADSLVFSTTGQNVEDALNIEIGGRNLIRNSETLVFTKYGFHSDVYTVDAEIQNGVLVLSAYPDITSKFTAEIANNVLTVTEQYETEATVHAAITGETISVN